MNVSFKLGDGNRSINSSFPFYKAQIDASIVSDLEVNFIGLVERPAIERNFQAFNKQRAMFIQNEEKRIVSGPAMVADMPLYRKDNSLGEYYVVFDKPTIQTIVQKFSAKGYLKNFNLFHDPTKAVNDVTIFNSFIADKDLGVPAMKGFEDLPDGSWFISAKVNNDKVWQKVKSGEIQGFSVEGLFNYVPSGAKKFDSETTLQRVKMIKWANNAIAAVLKKNGNEDKSLQDIENILNRIK